MDLDPDIEDILERGGQALMNGAFDKAHEALKRAEDIDPLDRDVLMFRAHLHATTGDTDTARNALEALIEHHGDDPVALASAAQMVLELDDDAESALSLAEEADELLEDIEVAPEDRDAARDMRVEVLALIADCRMRVGDREGAKEAAEAAIKLGPDHAGARTALGQAAFALGRLPEAKSALTAAQALDPEDAEVAWNLGWVLRLMGDEGAANAAFAEAARLAPEAFMLPGTFSDAFLLELVRDIAVALDAPLDALVREVPVVIDEQPPIVVDGLRSPTALLWVEGKPPHDLPEEARLDARPERIRVFRRNVEVAANDADSATAVLEAALGAELGVYFDFEPPDEDEEPS